MSKQAQRDVDRRPAALADKAYTTLRADLLTGGPLTASRRLVAVELARKLGVSRTPVREALDRLARLGYLQPLEGGGYERRRYRTRDVRDVYELRLLLEPRAAELAAEAASDTSPSAPAPDFSVQVARASGNRVLAHVVELLAERVAALRIDGSRDQGQPRLAPERDRRETASLVASAIRRGNRADARAAMARHLSIEAQVMLSSRTGLELNTDPTAERG